MKPRKIKVEYSPEPHDRYKKDFKITVDENVGMSSVTRYTHEELINLYAEIAKMLLLP